MRARFEGSEPGRGESRGDKKRGVSGAQSGEHVFELPEGDASAGRVKVASCPTRCHAAPLPPAEGKKACEDKKSNLWAAFLLSCASGRS